MSPIYARDQHRKIVEMMIKIMLIQVLLNVTDINKRSAYAIVVMIIKIMIGPTSTVIQIMILLYQ